MPFPPAPLPPFSFSFLLNPRHHLFFSLTLFALFSGLFRYLCGFWRHLWRLISWVRVGRVRRLGFTLEGLFCIAQIMLQLLQWTLTNIFRRLSHGSQYFSHHHSP